MKIVIVVPTYNEAENIGKLIAALDTEFKKIPHHNMQVLVVDSNSPDGTADVVRKSQKKYPFVNLLLEEEKNGLGAAYMYAFKHAMNKMNADVVMEMDADFQHDPKDVKRLIKKIDEGYDYVIGSRFAKGGSIPKEWAFYRKFLSRGGNLFSRVVLGIPNVTDFTAGFRATRVKGYLDKIDLDSILSKGYSYKFDLVYRFHLLGAKIAEVPTDFGLRDRGSSKMERNNFADSLRVVLTLKYRHDGAFIKFVLVGFVGLFTDLALSNLLRLTSLAANAAASLAAFMAMTVTFTINNHWSFNDRKIHGLKNKLPKFVKFATVSSIPIVFRYFFVAFIVAKFGENFITFNFALFVSVLFGLIWNYTMYTKLIWKKEIAQ